MLLVLLSKPRHQYPLDYVVFYDSGMEFDCIYRIRDRVKDLCRIHGVQFVELSPKEPFLYSMLERKVVERNGQGYHYGYSWCGGRCRWATTHKLNAIRDFKASLRCDVIDYVGIAYDEQERIPKKRPADKRYPLADDWGMSENDCLSYCRSLGWYWLEPCEIVEGGWIDLYDIFDRVSCWCCGNKNRKELYNIYCYLPQYWQRLCYLQSQTVRPLKGYYKGKPVGVFELENNFRKKEQKRRNENENHDD